MMSKAFSIILLFGTLFYSGCSDNSGDSGNSYSHTRSVGYSSNDLLSSEFSRLEIEVDFVSGYQPSQTALNNLKSFLESRLNKPGGISIVLDDELSSPGKSSFTTQEVYEIEKQHRDSFTDGSTLSAYFLILDAPYQQENVLGVAYFNTSMALFESVIRENTGGFGQPSAATVESSVLMHEFGHILGLVDTGSNMVTNHEDAEHEKHCNNENCLMYWAIQTTDLMGNLTGGSIPELDENCIQDLRANGGK